MRFSNQRFIRERPWARTSSGRKGHRVRAAVPTGSSEAKLDLQRCSGVGPHVTSYWMGGWTWGGAGNLEPGSSFHSMAISREGSAKSHEQPMFPAAEGGVSQLWRGIWEACHSSCDTVSSGCCPQGLLSCVGAACICLEVLMPLTGQMPGFVGPEALSLLPPLCTGSPPTWEAVVSNAFSTCLSLWAIFLHTDVGNAPHVLALPYSELHSDVTDSTPKTWNLPSFWATGVSPLWFPCFCLVLPTKAEFYRIQDLGCTMTFSSMAGAVPCTWFEGCVPKGWGSWHPDFYIRWALP